jgi:hypothetical protein
MNFIEELVEVHASRCYDRRILNVNDLKMQTDSYSLPTGRQASTGNLKTLVDQ